MTTAGILAPTIHDLFDPAALDQAILDGYIRRQVHPTEPLVILNYTEKAAYEGMWNTLTLGCRGLIHHADTWQVVARPFRKFFNHGQTGAPTLDLDARTVVTDKLDGSLGILHPLPGGGCAIATRGSFTSDQALHATEVWRQRYAGTFDPPPGYTCLFEIVYPENRIVCDYGDLDDLILLGAVNVATGQSVSATAATHLFTWPGPAAREFPYRSLAEALAAEPRPNAEGLVVHFVDVDERLKIKQEDYVRLHRIVTGLTARTVWEHLMAGQPLADLIEPLPDEFHPWVEQVAVGIRGEIDAEHARLFAKFQALYDDEMPDDWAPATREGRKEFALAAVGTPDSWAMFALFDGKDIRPELLKRARPEPYLTPSGRTYTEDNA